MLTTRSSSSTKPASAIVCAPRRAHQYPAGLRGGLMNPELSDRLALTGNLLRRVTRGGFAKRRPAVESLMSTFLELGKALGQSPDLAKERSGRFLLERTQGRIDPLLLPL